MKNYLNFLFLCSLSSSYGGEPSDQSVAYSTCFCGRPDALAPIGVMGDHLHPQGGLMISARTMWMSMDENYLGRNTFSDLQAQQVGPFGVIPTKMDMQMDMVSVMYSFTDDLSLMAMINHVDFTMDHAFGMGLPEGNTFRTTSNGWGDASIGVLTRLSNSQNSELIGGLNLLLPTAELDQTDLIPPAGGIRRLPYPMQLGHGSWGLAPTLTYTQHREKWSYGLQAKKQWLLHDNSEGYRLGDRFETSAWIAAPIDTNLSASVRASYSHWGNIEGKDPLITMLPVPTARENLRGGERLDLIAGLSYAFEESNTRLALEVGKSVWQDLKGPQLGSDYTIQLGLQYSW